VSTIPVSEVKVGPRFRQTVGDVEELAQSIELTGLLHPIVVTSDGQLVAGYRRLEAFKLLGRSEIPTTVIDPRNVRLAECHENMIRLNFQPSEVVEIARYLEPEERGAAKERMVAGKPCVQIPQGKTRDKVAAYAGVSARTLGKAAKVVEAAEADPEKFAPLLEEMDRTGKVDPSYRKLVKAERKANPPLPTAGKYRVLYADPPWPYEDHGATVSENYGGAVKHYPTMTIEEICALPVAQIAEKDSVLFLWATSPKLNEVFAIISAWGFAYKTSMVWNKDAHNYGYYVSVRHELLLISTRGSCRPDIEELLPSVVTIKRSNVHSEKPEHFRGMIDRMYTYGNRIELFARGAVPGPWVAWGLEADHA